jgi:hypothetical protein
LGYDDTKSSPFTQLGRLVAGRLGVEEARVSLSSVVARNPHATRDARTLARVGAIELRRARGGPSLTHADAQLVGLWGDMRRAGFTDEQGFGPEVVAMYVESANRLAHDEVRRFLAGLAGRQDEETAAAMARTALSAMLAFFGLLRMKAVLRELRAGGKTN